jgi:hypothetical protein
MRWLCTLFGHTGTEEESGYHVCSRCGEHALWCSRGAASCYGFDDPGTDYDLAAVIFWPWWWLKRKIPVQLLPEKCADCHKRLGKHNGCIPF